MSKKISNVDILGLTTDLSVSFNYGFEAAMMY
jgi:hypothetical protein